MVIEGKWERGTVVTGYRSHDGMVSYCLGDIPGSSGWGCGTGVPHVLREWEWNYFRVHHSEYIRWKRLCEADRYNGDKLKLPDTMEGRDIPQIELHDLVYCRSNFSTGYWKGSVTKIAFQCGRNYIIEVDECDDGYGRAMFSTGNLEYRDGEWYETDGWHEPEVEK